MMLERPGRALRVGSNVNIIECFDYARGTSDRFPIINDYAIFSIMVTPKPPFDFGASHLRSGWHD
jgi:hypothetical protein